MALILALLTATIPSPALSEAPEIVSAFVDAEVAPAQTAGDTGLTVDGGDELPAPEAAPEAAVEAPALDEAAAGYARVRAAAALYGDGEGTSLVAWIDGDSVVLVTEEGPLTGIALFTQRGILAGYMDAANLERLDAEATAAYLDAAAGGVAVALYDDRLDRPLTLSGCAFADDPAAVQAEEQVAGESEDTEAEDPEADGDETPKAAAVARLNRDAITIGVGEKYSDLSAVAASADVTLPKITWSSGNKKVAKVNAKTGVVTGVAAGSCTVTAKLPGGQALSCKVTVAKAPKSVSLEKTKLTLTVGMKARLTASVPKGTASGALSFKSSKSKYVTVDENGVVTAVKKGSATITVTTFNGKTATCKVTVKKAPAALAFACGSISIAVDQKVSLTAAAKTDSGDSTPADITYIVDAFSPDAGCIELDAAEGTVKGLRKGTAIVTATTPNGLLASCTVTVDAAPKSIALNKSSATIGVGEKYDALSAELTPPSGAATCATAVTWSSSDKDVAKVNATTGVITGVKKGTATIKATAAGGKTATCKVTVKKAPTGLTVKPEVGALKVGQTGQYKVTLSPSGSAGRITYASSDTAVATVDDSGFVTAVAPGNITITVTTYNGHSKTVSLEVSDDEESDDDDDEGGSDITSSANAKKLEYVISVAQNQLGKPYVYGSGYSKDSNPRGFDCSGLMYWCFLHIDIKLKDTAYKQGYDDSLKKITKKSSLRRGDLVFFNTNSSDGDLSDHSGLYLGNGKFIHASSSAAKVVISDMSKSGSYYDRVFSWGRRVLN